MKRVAMTACPWCQCEKVEAENRIAGLEEALRRASKHLRDLEDEGPYGEGWQSDELLALRLEIGALLGGPK